jgi:PII-like signaling protein
LYVIDQYEEAQLQGTAPPQVTYITGIGGLAAQANSLNSTFPTISLPVAVIVVDSVGRIQQALDKRSSC